MLTKKTSYYYYYYFCVYNFNKYIMSVQLTLHFTLDELTKTKSGLSNVPNVSQINALRNLCRDILEPLRSSLGNSPIIIHSGFRCPAVNKSVGGVPTSQHLSGCAADISSPCYTAYELYKKIEKLVIEGDFNIGQCILYNKSHFVHVSLPSRTHKNDFLVFNK